jgi:hypothetical protein
VPDETTETLKSAGEFFCVDAAKEEIAGRGGEVVQVETECFRVDNALKD